MFEDDRIKLRKLTAEDFKIYQTWRNDIEVMKSTSLSLDQYTLKETEDYILLLTTLTDAKGYIIEDKKSRQPLGIISLIHIDFKNRSAECVLDIGEKAIWGSGIGTAALELLLAFGFNELNLHRIYLQVFSFNNGAIRLYEKIGFSHEGRQRQALFRAGQWHDILMLSLLKNEYCRLTSSKKEQADDFH